MISSTTPCLGLAAASDNAVATLLPDWTTLKRAADLLQCYQWQHIDDVLLKLSEVRAVS